MIREQGSHNTARRECAAALPQGDGFAAVAGGRVVLMGGSCLPAGNSGAAVRSAGQNSVVVQPYWEERGIGGGPQACYEVALEAGGQVQVGA
jgi:hypothetical protein